VERTLRGAARGTDEVVVEGAGRFRILLRGTGELAARAYLRRIRATVEPLLETFEGRLRLVTATATVLDEPLDAATATAERRLAAALAAARDADETDGDPRAAAD
jgi:GGDEF domain-containing protein